MEVLQVSYLKDYREKEESTFGLTVFGFVAALEVFHFEKTTLLSAASSD